MIVFFFSPSAVKLQKRRPLFFSLFIAQKKKKEVANESNHGFNT